MSTRMIEMRFLLSFLLSFFVTWITPTQAIAQHVYRIGALLGEDQFALAVEGFKKKMAELGYIEGKNISYQVYNGESDREKLRRFAEKLVQDKPDLIVTSSTTASIPVAKASAGTNIPVVFLSTGNPLAFVKSYASSGNNLTGISTSSIDLTAKRMELLKELAPEIKRVISLHNPDGGNYHESLKATREAAKKLGVKLIEVGITTSDELIHWAKEQLNRKLGDGIVYQPDLVILPTVPEIIPHIIKQKLPFIAINIARVKEGALAAYAPNYFALGEQGAILVDKIRRGARPAGLPVEQPLKLNLVLNLKTVKAIGLKVPKDILLRADEVIE